MKKVVSVFCLPLLLFTVFYTFQSSILVTSASGEVGNNAPEAIVVSNKRLVIPSSTECYTGKTSTTIGYWRWAVGSKVKVYFLQGFNDAEIVAMTKAFNNWNDALREINSDISFEIAGMTDRIVTVNNTITVKRTDTFIGKSKRLAEIQPYIQSRTNTLARAEINVGTSVKDLNVFTSMINHEVGHSLGLSDCVDCKGGSTAMAAFRGKNKDNKAFSPTRCDKYVVAASYFINNFETTSALLNQFK